MKTNPFLTLSLCFLDKAYLLIQSSLHVCGYKFVCSRSKSLLSRVFKQFKDLNNKLSADQWLKCNNKCVLWVSYFLIISWKKRSVCFSGFNQTILFKLVVFHNKSKMNMYKLHLTACQQHKDELYCSLLIFLSHMLVVYLLLLVIWNYLLPSDGTKINWTMWLWTQSCNY